MQAREVSQQQAALDKQESDLAELRETGERLKQQLEEKDAFIRRLNERLEEKDGYIGLLNQRLESIEARLGQLDKRWTEPGSAPRARNGSEGDTSALLARLEELGKHAPEASALPGELSARLERFCTAAEALLAERAAPAPADPPEGEDASPSEVRGSPSDPEAEAPARSPRYSLSKDRLTAMFRSVPAARRQGPDGKQA